MVSRRTSGKANPGTAHPCRTRLRQGLRRARRGLARQGLSGEDWALLAVALGVALMVIGGR